MPFEHPNPLLTKSSVSSATPGLPGSGKDFVDRAPTSTVAPVISGTPTQGQTLTLTSAGTWDAYPDATLTRQWRRGSSDIAGATATTYVLVVGDVGANITCRVTATNSLGTAFADSNALGPVVAL